jgi:hypothetical protein
MSAARA